MGLPVEINPLLISSSGYVVGRSLRFRNSATAYLSRSPASAGNQQKMTFSFWAKRGQLGVSRGIYCSGASGGGATQGGAYITFNGDTFTVNQQTNNAYDWILTTTQVFRDPSAWYHIVVAIDTTQATSSNRVLMYVNGVQVTSFSSATYPTLNLSTKFNASGATNLGAGIDAGAVYIPFDGYLAEVNFIDGQALTSSSFGAYDTNGVWQPLKYGGTYGTNGFYLPFSNTTSTTTLVQDSSGNGNNWTPNNISLTAGTTYDSMIDSPTVSALSSNYAVWNQLQKTSTLSQANLLSAGGGSAIFYSVASTISIPSGKWYWEITCVSNTDGLTGIVETNQMIDVIRNGNYVGQTSLGYGYHANGKKYNNATSVAYGATYTTNDIIGVAFNADTGDLTFYKNGTSQGTAYTVSTAYTWLPADSVYTSDSKAVNFGQRPFSYTPPTGYSALNTYNLPTPTIKNGALYNAATLYTGTGASNAISNSQNNGGNNALGVTFQPDFVWAKSRSAANNNILVNSIVGANSYLISNLTNSEATNANVVASFNSNGFTVGSDGTLNTNGQTAVGWQWKGGGTGVSNTSGSITSTVSANTTAGFSVVTYTGNGVGGATVGHGLGVTPSMIIPKNRDSGTGGWPVYHVSTGTTKYTELNNTNATGTDANGWQAVSSSTFTIGTNLNQSGNKWVAYCFAAVRGYSAFGSYTGNGSSDGPFVYTGFRPRFVLLKNITTAGNGSWVMFDTTRNPSNVQGLQWLFADSSGAESTANSAGYFDILSNGFKCRGSGGNINVSGESYIYACFAENPFNYSRAR